MTDPVRDQASIPMFIPRILSLANISVDSCHIAAVGYIIA